jgi:hypothetical protein
MNWLPDGFEHRERVELPTGHHVRPIREADVDIDYPAIMGSRERLWTMYGDAWGWPPADFSHEDDRVDLARHEAEIAAHQTFNYANAGSREGSDAFASGWVVDEHHGGELERAVAEFVPRWLAESWGFRAVHYFP